MDSLLLPIIFQTCKSDEICLYKPVRIIAGGLSMSKTIMIQGTMSSAGKSFIAAGSCRKFKQDRYRVAPFKSQNMALNSFITDEGLEMGRAQVMQAEAAGVKPSVYMNPILLKPTNDTGSQVIVNGKAIGNMSAVDYFAYKKKLIPDIKKALSELERDADIIVIEGAGSPAEINLKEQDIVNMGMAQMADAPVLLVGDIDRGGVFAQLCGTLELLESDERARVGGLIINKFRGDKSILDSGIDMIEERLGVPVVGIVPYMDVKVDDEDSLTERFAMHHAMHSEGLIDIAVIRFPRISNISDFLAFEQYDGVSVRYVASVDELKNPDMIILPGSKNTIGDLKWMRQNGLEAAIKKRAEHTPIFGICGGYQMLGYTIEDAVCAEEGGFIRGMELLPIDTVMRREKQTAQTEGTLYNIEGIFSSLGGRRVSGYEIHMGSSTAREGAKGLCRVKNMQTGEVYEDGAYCGNVYGTYLHGFFDCGEIAPLIIDALASKKGVSLDGDSRMDYAAFKETQYDKMAQILREYLDMDAIYKMLDKPKIPAELRAITIEPLDKTKYAEVKSVWDSIGKPLGSLGHFEKIFCQIGAIQGTADVRLKNKQVLIMCADNGIVAEGVSQSGTDVTRIVTANMGKGISSVCKMAKRAGATVLPVDVGICGTQELEGVRNCKIAEGTRDFLKESAMTSKQAMQAIQIGIDLVGERKKAGEDILALGEMGIGNTTTSSALAAALLRLPVEEVTGKGAGLSDAGLSRKIEVIKEALSKYRLEEKTAFDALCCVGGFDIAALAGVCIGGALYHVPIVLDGVISMVAALTAERMVKGTRQYLIASHISKEPAAQKIAQELELLPVIDAKLSLGEGTGAVMMFSLLDLADTIYSGRTTFEDIEVEQYIDYEKDNK